MKRTHENGKLRLEHAGQDVALAGWVARRRDLGGVVFIDLRDRSGVVQLVFRPDVSQEALHDADRLRSEYVIAVKGAVIARDADSVNPKLETGEIEVMVRELTVLNMAKTPPFAIEDGGPVEEAVRLRYRYLDLRRPQMQKTLQLRHRVLKSVRDFMDGHGFLEIETPYLTKSTPEGARDYLVPSRLRPGEFYALPQSPQLFKQLLMVAGYERYFQLVRCFRDEDLRADRQPEFTQLDIEVSFADREFILDLMEQMVAELFVNVLRVPLERPFMRLTYREAMERFGSDKPDLRFGLELRDVSSVVAGSEFKVFGDALARKGQVKALAAPGCGSYSRKEIEELGKLAARYKAKGLAWMAVEEGGAVRSPIAKFFTPEQLSGIIAQSMARPGDLILFVADHARVAADALGALRTHLGRTLGLIEEGVHRFLWVTEFPQFEYDEEAGRHVAMHHPFTMPMEEDLPLLESRPGDVRAQAYDLVLNGYEIGGGSTRIHQRATQERMFAALGFSAQEAAEKFGFFLDAFDYGAPPHGGIALGMDRLVMLMAGQESLREVIAFPKTASAADLMVEAPSEISREQWDTLRLQPAPPKKPTPPAVVERV